MNELSHPIQLRFCEKVRSAVCSTMHNIKVDCAASSLVRTFQFVGLIDGHLGILVAVEQ